MGKSKGSAWTAVFGLSAAFAVYALATQDSAPPKPPEVAALVPTVSQPSYTNSNIAAPATLPTTFMGYECTEDCSGHEAGYEWAADEGVTDPDECGGRSDSFIEGCEAYAEEAQEESSDDLGY